MSVIPIGLYEQLYLKLSSGGYAGQPTFASTDAVRSLGFDLNYNPGNWTNAKDRVSTPGYRRRVQHKDTADWALKPSQLFPSGTAGTAPETDVILTQGLGTKTVGSASTTVSASPSPTTTGFTVASPTGLAVGKLIAVNVTGVGIEVRMISGLATAAVTVSQAFSAAPTAGDTVKTTGVQYTLATNPASDFCVGSYITTNGDLFSRQFNGCVVDKMGFAFDANDELMFSASGPACDQTMPAQSQPGGYTTVGTVMPSGLAGDLRVADASIAFQKGALNVTNGMKVRMVDYGKKKGTAFYRAGRREIDLSLDMYAEDRTSIYPYAVSGATLPILIQTGAVSGAIIVVYMPAVQFAVPKTPVGDAEVSWQLQGKALDVAGNDALVVGFF